MNMSNSINLVIIGKRGSGKSATGNSILGRNAFRSYTSSSRLTSTSELQSTVLKDGRVLNVVDTPGLFDHFNEAESIGKEIVQCLNLLKDGIHGMLMVYSHGSQFTPDDETALERLLTVFGEEVLDYIIVVITRVEHLQNQGISFKEYLDCYIYGSQQKLIQFCNKRTVLFDNKTCDEKKAAKQLEELMILVDTVVSKNRGKPFSNSILYELKEGALMRDQREKVIDSMIGSISQQIYALKEEIYKSYDDHLVQITEKVDLKLKQTELSKSKGTA